MPRQQVDPDAEEKEKLEDLQKRYRLMEGDRKSYSEESQNIIRKQRYVVPSSPGNDRRTWGPIHRASSPVQRLTLI